MILNENLFEDSLKENYEAMWINGVSYSDPIMQQYADLVNDVVYNAFDNINVLALSKINDLPEVNDYEIDNISKAISNLVKVATDEYFKNTSKNEALKESIEYIKWVQLPDGKWKIWGSNNGPELDPNFLDRARKQNDIEYKDARVSKNGEYPFEESVKLGGGMSLPYDDNYCIFVNSAKKTTYITKINSKKEFASCENNYGSFVGVEKSLEDAKKYVASFNGPAKNNKVIIDS